METSPFVFRAPSVIYLFNFLWRSHVVLVVVFVLFGLMGRLFNEQPVGSQSCLYTNVVFNDLFLVWSGLSYSVQFSSFIWNQHDRIAQADFDILFWTELSISRLFNQRPVRLAPCTLEGNHSALGRLLLCCLVCEEVILRTAWYLRLLLTSVEVLKVDIFCTPYIVRVVSRYDCLCLTSENVIALVFEWCDTWWI